MNCGSKAVCEIRVPTYRRLQLLRRALNSIVEQTHNQWRCIVFDDCPNGSAASIVQELNDPRIEYCRNRKSLGAIGNIDRAFESKSLLGGRYAFVLEDDNYLLSNHIENSIDILEGNQAKVAFCNQLCERVVVPGEPGEITRDRTLDWMYPEGLFNARCLWPALLFSHGFSNGAAFWRTDCLSDFQIGSVTKHPGIQESLRLLRIRDAVYVSLKPTSVWRCNDPRESYVNVQRANRSLWQLIKMRWDNVLEKREKLEYKSAVIKIVSRNNILEYAKLKDDHAADFERSLLLCGHNLKLSPRGQAARVRLLVIGWAIRLLIPAELEVQAV